MTGNDENGARHAGRRVVFGFSRAVDVGLDRMPLIAEEQDRKYGSEKVTELQRRCFRGIEE